MVGLWFSKALWALPFIGITGWFLCDWALSFVSRLVSARALTAGMNLVFSCLFIAAIWTVYLRAEYRSQQASLTEGELTPIDLTDGDHSHGDMEIQIGPNGPVLESGNGFQGISPLFKFAYDAGLRLSKGHDGMVISTPVRDRNGNLIGEIDENHWKVYPPYCSDKNYDEHRLEIKDGGGHVVLQVALFVDRIQLQGEWHDQFGKGVRFMQVPGNAEFSFWKDEQGEKESLGLIRPIFLYPSSTHWEELATQR